MSNFKINEKGYWESVDSSGHVHDYPLCNAIKNYFRSKEILNVLDLGCGMGDYARSFVNEGFECDAYDGNPNTVSLTRGLGKVLDFSEDFDLEKTYDCVLTLEVGEHIPKEFEQTFLNNVTKHSKDKIILSWAVIGQGGDGHVNCQNNDYIIEQMKNRGFDIDMVSSNLLRTYATAPWFKNTIMVFNKA
jgi:2-polyprenyl-3-methyl-5-hydroxy-6-metoxy-1,4-benzoquinol methylase